MKTRGKKTNPLERNLKEREENVHPYSIYTMRLFWARLRSINHENRDCSMKHGTTGRTDSENNTQHGNKL